MSKPLNRVATGLLASMVLVAGACSGSGSTQAAQDGETTQTTEYESPLLDFLGIDANFANADNRADQAQIERETQEKIAACMRAEGFEYTPTSTGSFQAFSTGDEEGLEWGTKAWVDKYGFGVSTQLYSQEDVGPDLVGHNFGSFLQEDTSKNDPNEAYIQTLSEGDQQAYYAALYGNDSGPEYDPSLSDEENEALIDEYFGPDYQPSGCASTAYDEAFGDQFGDIDKFYQEFGDQIQELEERFNADPRVAEVRSKTKACIADKGYDYTDEETAYEDLQDRISDIGNGGGTVVFTDDMTDEEFDASALEQLKLSEADREKLKAAQEYEIAFAQAVVECSGGSLSIDADPELTKIRIQMEQEFIDANSDALSEFKGANG